MSTDSQRVSDMMDVLQLLDTKQPQADARLVHSLRIQSAQSPESRQDVSTTTSDRSHRGPR